MERIYNFENRLIRFAAECSLFTHTIKNDRTGWYYKDQLIRASGSAALHYGEAQGSISSKDFVYKLSNTRKELKESRVVLKILLYIKYGEQERVNELLNECKELITIVQTMMLNKKQKTPPK